MLNNQQIIVDVIVGYAIMEAIVKPVTVRAMKQLMRFLDRYIHFIPDWLHTPF